DGCEPLREDLDFHRVKWLSDHLNQLQPLALKPVNLRQLAQPLLESLGSRRKSMAQRLSVVGEPPLPGGNGFKMHRYLPAVGIHDRQREHKPAASRLNL